MKKFDIARFDAYTVCRDLLRNLWVILLAALIGYIGSSCYYNYIYRHKFTSTMTLAVNLSGYTSSAASTSLARTVQIADTLDDVIESNAMVNLIQKEMDGALTGTISADRLGETNLVTVRVTDDSPARAFETLKVVRDNYEKVTSDVFTGVVIGIVVDPQMPTGPSNAVSEERLKLVVTAAAALLVAGLTVLLSFLRDTVKNESNVEKELAARLFSTVYRVKGLNSKLPARSRRLMITNPLVGYEFVNSFQRMAVKMESLSRVKRIKSVMITSVGENEGKTTVAVNLSAALAQNGHRVLLVDCDMRKPAVYRFFENVPQSKDADFNAYISGASNINQLIKHDVETGVYFVGNITAGENTPDKLASRRFSDVVSAFKEQFDFVILDTPPCGVAVDPEVVAGVADAVLMVVRQDYISVTDINDHLESLSKSYIAGCVFNHVSAFKITSAEKGTNGSATREVRS